MDANRHTPGPWRITYLGGCSTVLTAARPQHLDRRIPAYAHDESRGWSVGYPFLDDKAQVRWDFVCYSHADARLIAAAPDLLAALHEGRRAIGDHFAPDDCYATGPMTGDPIRDLVQCPACSFIAAYEAAIAKTRA